MMPIDLIKKAITAKNRIVLSYSDGERKVEPYLIGDMKNDNRVLVAYQIDGYSESGNEYGWKLFSLNKIENVTITTESFQVNSQYNSNDSRMKTIIHRI